MKILCNVNNKIVVMIWMYDWQYFRFTGNVKLKGVIIIGDEGEQHPRVMKL